MIWSRTFTLTFIHSYSIASFPSYFRDWLIRSSRDFRPFLQNATENFELCAVNFKYPNPWCFADMLSSFEVHWMSVLKRPERSFNDLKLVNGHFQKHCKDFKKLNEIFLLLSYCKNTFMLQSNYMSCDNLRATIFIIRMTCNDFATWMCFYNMIVIKNFTF